MKGRVLVLAADRPRPLAALVEDGVLVDLLTDAPVTGAQPGEVRLGVMRRMLGNAGAAQLDIGGETGFLPKGAGLEPGAQVIVEVMRGAGGGKDARLSRNVAHRSRILVHTPRAPGINASRKIAAESERARLVDIIRPFEAEGGWVLRTAAEGLSPETLLEQADHLLVERGRVEALAVGAAPGLLRPAPGAIAVALTEWPRAETVIADRGAAALAPDALVEADPLDVADLHGALEALTRPRVPLAGGGWMSVEPTEALVAVDVNAGALSSSEANRLAALALARQLRLRGSGGAVAVDFAGAPGAKARAALEATLSADPALRIAGWGPLGFLLLERPRDRPALTGDAL